jgi:glycosyltransferase involved in cell wall biosynthesis
MKLLYLCGKERSYIRNAMMLKGFADCGCEIADCSASSGSYLGRFISSVLKSWKAGNTGIDLVFVGCLGHYFVPLVRKVTAKPIIFDPFVSMYDTMCLDRKRFRPDSLVGRVLYRLDRCSCQMAEMVLLDTDAHIEYFRTAFGLPKDKFHRVFVGADESLFYPRQVEPDPGRFRVFYYSSFLPLHGTQFVVQAAALLRGHRDIEFTVVGKGLEHGKVLSLAKSLGVDNVRFIDWLPYQDLPAEIAKSDLCLGGHFSDIDKARRVIAGKSFQFIAMHKPVIVGDCPGNRELFADRQNALFVRMADADSLARAILELRDDAALREGIASAGYQTFLEHGSTAAIGRELAKILGAL